MERETKLAGDRENLTDIAVALSDLALQPSVSSALEAMREFLGMEAAFVGELTEDSQVFRATSGDIESFGVPRDAVIPLEQTYCQRVLSGRLPNLIPDVRGEARAAELPMTEAADVGAFTSVPLVFSDGRVYGTLCAASHEPKLTLGYQELRFLQVFARIVADQLERDQTQDHARRLEMQAAAAATLVAAVQARDSYTGEHSAEVVNHAVAVARELGLTDDEVTDVAQVALLHDIGKIGIPDAILHKAGALTEEEWESMRTHPVSSQRLINNVPDLAHLGPAIRAEHEHWDGGGYPDGLAGEEIPLASRITLVCDAYHAMTSDRPYRPAMPAKAAQREIVAGSGSQFCPKSAEALLTTLTHANRPSRPHTHLI